jgi:alpha-galactosidase/6-phospho-beta-glucosidase family protein
MSTLQLAVMGGGSVNWMRKLMRDVYLLGEVEGGSIRLLDPDREPTEAVARMLRRFNEQRGKDFAITIPECRD